MSSEIDKGEALFSVKSRENAVVHSALWAAAGDALGWITELSHGAAGVVRRTGSAHVRETVGWQRVIGGRSGPKVDLPAGTYSDDTQLRLAVCRSIRGDGSFDAETFAKIEVTVWPTYALGAGLGTKAAANNLARRSVNWFSNFFESGGQSYIKGGGNGAAMRVQPHVWCSKRGGDHMILNVLRDSLTTHGHPHGFCGAVFHALSLWDTLKNGVIPTPRAWLDYVNRFDDIVRIIQLDPQLATFWQSAWENAAGRPVADAIAAMADEARADLGLVQEAFAGVSRPSYHSILEKLGCLKAEFRGSGFKTALAALALAHLHRDASPEAALVDAANELESDTDTIATMAGALLGALAPEPRWAIQDRDYIIREGQRLARISMGERQDHFTYPDLGHWNPPAKQTDPIGQHEGRLVLAGLGELSLCGPEYQAGDAIWGWFSLPFGQTILAKRKAKGQAKFAATQLPGPRQSPPVKMERNSPTVPVEIQQDLPMVEARQQKDKWQNPSTVEAREPKGLDAMTDRAIQSDFDPKVLGSLLLSIIDQSQSVDVAVGFAAIVAKARLTRQRRGR